MVSFHTPLSPNQRKANLEFENSSNKRKWEEQPKEEEDLFKKRFKQESVKSIFDIELHLETPLPSDWQRCLDIQSGQVYFYNTRTRTRTSRDPRRSPEPSSSGPMGLDLQLNLLPCESLKSSNQADHDENFTEKNSYSSYYSTEHLSNSNLHKNFSDGLVGGGHREMVAAVCKRCFMLVMLCKSSPACPNCKFMHPPEQSTLNLFKKRLNQPLY